MFKYAGYAMKQRKDIIQAKFQNCLKCIVTRNYQGNSRSMHGLFLQIIYREIVLKVIPAVCRMTVANNNRT